LVAIPLMIGSCAAVERLSGISPYGQPPSFVIRRVIAGGFLILYIVFVWWYAVYPEIRRRRLFLRGKLCPVCNRPLQAKRVHHPIQVGADGPSPMHWFQRPIAENRRSMTAKDEHSMFMIEQADRTPATDEDEPLAVDSQDV
jgi:hypothetical protein